MELQELLQRIDALKAEIDALRPLSRDVEGRIMQKLRLDWNFHSSNIEGNSLTFGETKTFLLHGLTAEGKPLKDHLEIRGHNEAIEGLEDIIKGDRLLTEYEIKSLHQIILGEPYQIPAQTPEGLPTQRWVTPGKYKSQPNHVRTATGETFYFTSPEDTPAEMERLMAWYNEAISDQDLHPLITAATFHYKFIRIHPFDDGNGRIARILMNLVLMKGGLPPAIIRTDDKENYYRALRMADGGELDSFTVYVGEQLVRSLNIYRRGVSGNDVEEWDDVDKKIALFKAQLGRPGDGAGQMGRSEAAITKIVHDSIIPLIELVVRKLQQFDELFANRQLTVAPLLNINYDSLDELLKDLRELKWQGRDRIILSYRWKGFIHWNVGPFDYDTFLGITFREEDYIIDPARQVSVIKHYHQMLAEEEWQIIANDLAEAALRFVQQRVANSSSQ